GDRRRPRDLARHGEVAREARVHQAGRARPIPGRDRGLRERAGGGRRGHIGDAPTGGAGPPPLTPDAPARPTNSIAASTSTSRTAISSTAPARGWFQSNSATSASSTAAMRRPARERATHAPNAPNVTPCPPADAPAPPTMRLAVDRSFVADGPGPVTHAANATTRATAITIRMP